MTSDDETTIKQLIDVFHTFSKARHWDEQDSLSFLAKSVVIEAAELLEHFQQDAKITHRRAAHPAVKQAISHEMVDILYYLFMLAKMLDIEVTTAVREKLTELESRYPVVSTASGTTDKP